MSQKDEPVGEWIGGHHAVAAAIAAARPPICVWIAVERRDGRASALAEQAQARGVPVERVPTTRLDDRLPGVRHQGCAAQLAPVRTLRESELAQLLAATDDPWVLALDQVQDPHNLGACLRSAAAAGVTAVIAPRKRAAGLTAAARKVAAGAAERVPFVPVTNLARALDRLKTAGFWVVGLDGESEQSVFEAGLPFPIVWVAGGEARGLRALTARACDLRVAIPMSGGMDSLNVSVAVGVALFETVRQRNRGD